MLDHKWHCLFFLSHLYIARGRLEGNHEGTLALLSGPVAPDPVLHPGCYSARSPTHHPRIGPNAMHILERGQKGVVGELLKLDGVSVMPVPKPSKCNWLPRSINVSYVTESSSVLSWNGIIISSYFIFWPHKNCNIFNFWLLEQRAHDFGKENVRRLREIQRRCKEQEAERAQSRTIPVKALWTSSKYQNVPSRVMVQLQVRIMSVKDESQVFSMDHFSCTLFHAGF